MIRASILALVLSAAACTSSADSKPHEAADGGTDAGLLVPGLGDAGAPATDGPLAETEPPSPDPASPPPADAGVGGDLGPQSIETDAGPATPSAAAQFFRVEQVHRIEITVAPAVWNEVMTDHTFYGLRNEKRWFSADFTIDGVTLKNVAFHTFGFGSRIEQKAKPNLSLDINRNVPGQSLRGIKRMRIKNNGQDVTGLHQALVYEAMQEANLIAPRSTNATITVNGEPYGFYFVEETFTKDFVREHTGTDDGAAYEAQGCQGFVMPPDGCMNLAGAYEPDFNATAGMGEALAAVCTAANGPPEGFMNRAAPHIILREWVDQIAIDTALAGDQDGFSVAASNFRVYQDTKLGKLRLVILGADDTFIAEKYAHPDFLHPEPKPSCTEDHPQYRDIILEKLIGSPEGLAYYRDAVRRLRTGVMAAAKLKQRIDALWAVVGPHVKADLRNVQYMDPEERKEEIKRYIDLRWAALEQAGF